MANGTHEESRDRERVKQLSTGGRKIGDSRSYGAHVILKAAAPEGIGDARPHAALHKDRRTALRPA